MDDNENKFKCPICDSRSHLRHLEMISERTYLPGELAVEFKCTNCDWGFIASFTATFDEILETIPPTDVFPTQIAEEEISNES